MIYLDSCATTKPRKDVIVAILNALEEDFGNPSSLHRHGLKAEKLIKGSRKIIAQFLNVGENEIFFTSGGTESNNLAIQGVINNKASRRGHIIISAMEHPAVKNTVEYLQKNGCRVTVLKNDDHGMVDIEDLKKSISDDTVLVSLIHVNNETGAIQDIQQIGSILRELPRKPHFHLDGVQSFGKIPFSLKKSGVDSFAFSGHKIYGPKGVGGLYINSKTKISPIIFGGNQEKGIRSGTENVPGIVGMGEAVACLSRTGPYELTQVKSIKRLMIELLEKRISDVRINSPIDDYFSPYILNISIPDTRGEVLVHYLEDRDIYVSTTSACSSKGVGKSHVLKAIGLDDKSIEGAVRISFSWDTEEQHIRQAVDEISSAVNEIRSIMRR